MDFENYISQLKAHLAYTEYRKIVDYVYNPDNLDPIVHEYIYIRFRNQYTAKKFTELMLEMCIYGIFNRITLGGSVCFEITPEAHAILKEEKNDRKKIQKSSWEEVLQLDDLAKESYTTDPIAKHFVDTLATIHPKHMIFSDIPNLSKDKTNFRTIRNLVRRGLLGNIKYGSDYYKMNNNMYMMYTKLAKKKK